jgi:hypothetical protein
MILPNIKSDLEVILQDQRHFAVYGLWPRLFYAVDGSR